LRKMQWRKLLYLRPAEKGGWRELHSEELHNLYRFSHIPEIIMVIKSKEGVICGWCSTRERDVKRIQRKDTIMEE
jgi:hypothetical protein